MSVETWGSTRKDYQFTEVTMSTNDKKYMDVGMAIADQHKKEVMKLMALGSSPDKALNGCIVWLAAKIMVEAQKLTEG